MAAKAALKDVGKSKKYTAQAFQTKIPNIDIRHGGNFSGQRRARQRCYSIPYWGSFHKVMGQPPPGPWYQEATINGTKMPTRRTRDTSERRWNTFIKPHLHDVKGGTFLDMGCNAGFYLRKAADMGFKAIGIEKDVVPLRHALYWESCDPKEVQIIHGNVTEYDIPEADVVLMACVHYWLTPHELKGVERTLRGRAKRVIVMGRRQTAAVHKSPAGYGHLRDRFKHWSAGSVIKNKRHYSATFVNPMLGKLITVNVEHIFPRQQLVRSRFYKSFRKLVETGDGSEYANYLQWRKFPLTRLERQKRLIEDIKKNGIKKPIVMEGERVVDGDHRIIIAKTLGIKEVEAYTHTQEV